MKDITIFFKKLKKSIMDDVFTPNLGTITEIKGNKYNVYVKNVGTLVNLRSLYLNYELQVGDEVLIIYLENDLNNGIIVGKF